MKLPIRVPLGPTRNDRINRIMLQPFWVSWDREWEDFFIWERMNLVPV